MENELCHYGILGMRWGIRRTKDQLRREARKRGDTSEEKETAEQKKARILKGTNAKELYENRDLLTTAEIKERLDRIDTERRLSDVAAKQKKTAYDRIDSILKAGRKASEIYEFCQKPMMKALRKQLLGDKEPPKSMSPNLEKVYKNLDKLTDDQLQKYIKRASQEDVLRKMLEKERERKTSSDKKEEDDK